MGFKVSNIVNTGGFPFYLIQGLKKEFTIDYWVETGTAGGLSVKEAAKHFKHCWTIELIKGRAKKEDFDNVTWMEGNSVDLLPEILYELRLIKEKIPKQVDGTPNYLYSIFWLDAHWSEPYKNDTQYKECYVMDELEILKTHEKDAIIIIDDARLFCGHPPAPNNPKDWPTIQDIFVKLKNDFPYNYSTIVDDYILSLPERMREPIDREWRQNYPIRYPSHEDSIRMQARNVVNEFKKYIDNAIG